MTMKYNKGKAGPVSINQLEIFSVSHLGEGPSAYARGEGQIKKANGTKTGVTFMIQGGNYATLRDRLVAGETLWVPVRWTGGSAVTIVDKKTLDKFRAENPRQQANDADRAVA